MVNKFSISYYSHMGRVKKSKKNKKKHSVSYFNSHLENGSDMVVSVIYHLLREFMQDHGGKLPRKLHLNLGKF